MQVQQWFVLCHRPYRIYPDMFFFSQLGSSDLSKYICINSLYIYGILETARIRL